MDPTVRKSITTQFVTFWMNAEQRAVIKDTQKSADTTLKREGADIKRIVLTPILTKKI